MHNSNLQAALRFLEWWPGAKFFPAYYRDGSHKGLVKWGKESSGDFNQLSRWAEKHGDRSYLCINLKASNLLTLDVDNKNGKSGSNALWLMKLENGDLPFTLTVNTPSGGEHYVFGSGGLKHKYKSNCSGKLGEGVDIPGMIPVPGSMVPGKGEYEIVTDTRPSRIPDWLSDKVAAFGKVRERKERKDDLGVEPDQPHNVNDAIKYLARAETCSPGNRDNTSYKVACAVRDYGISMEMCEAILVDHWVPRCDMGDWDLDNVQAKIESAYERAAGDFGNRDLSRHFKDVTKLEMDGPSATEQNVRLPYLEKLSAASFTAADIEPSQIEKRKWLVHGRFIEAFVTVTVSPGGVGKSTMSMLEGLAVCCNKGEEWLNRKTYGNQAVWIHNLEDPRDELKRRAAAVAQFYGIGLDHLDHLHMTSGLDLPLTFCREGRNGFELNARALQACEDFIVRHAIKLWIIDPLVKAHQLNENDNGQMDKLMTQLSALAARTGVAIHLVHHTRKKNNDTGNGDAETARGASSVVNAARVAHTLNGMGAKDAQNYGVGDERHMYIRVDDAKANLTPPSAKADWFKRVSVKLPNGDYVGVLQYTSLDALVKNIPFNQLLIQEVAALVPHGQVPVNQIASLLDARGEIIKDDGQPMGKDGIRKAIERVFSDIVEFGGKTMSIGNGPRKGHNFPRNTVLWIDTTCSEALLEAEAIAEKKGEVG